MNAQHPLDHAAAALTDALQSASDTVTPLPPALAARIIADGEAQLRARAPRPVVPPTSASPSRALRVAAVAGWLAAAASLAVWASGSRAATAPAATNTTVSVTPASADDARLDAAALVALRTALLADSTSLRRTWAPSTDPAARGAGGDLVWNAAQQRGVMRFTGLVPNDPRVAQYQLWIVDASRDARYPVDGGVFDVTDSGEVLVLITPRLPVDRPTLFAITLERPGGVVVSSRERLVLAAPVDG
ncbi:MAG: anti-sigma factor [Gemmatimonadaceae bacterium]|jgi:hypothetical protein|nr:anti-sigma factor [Gemmatimonadaceae bacterium]